MQPQPQPISAAASCSWLRVDQLTSTVQPTAAGNGVMAAASAVLEGAISAEKVEDRGATG